VSPPPLVPGGGHTRLRDRRWGPGGSQFGRGDRHYGAVCLIAMKKIPRGRITVTSSLNKISTNQLGNRAVVPDSLNPDPGYGSGPRISSNPDPGF
jgi:hypothetical protein